MLFSTLTHAGFFYHPYLNCRDTNKLLAPDKPGAVAYNAQNHILIPSVFDTSISFALNRKFHAFGFLRVF